MRIGIVCYPTFGGSGVLATELGKALADKGHQVHFITYQQPVRLIEFNANIFYHEVRVASYPLFDYPPYETALAMVEFVGRPRLVVCLVLPVLILIGAFGFPGVWQILAGLVLRIRGGSRSEHLLAATTCCIALFGGITAVAPLISIPGKGVSVIGISAALANSSWNSIVP